LPLPLNWCIGNEGDNVTIESQTGLNRTTSTTCHGKSMRTEWRLQHWQGRSTSEE
jgi:hypothetical protein